MLLTVLAAVIAAAIATITRSTGGFLGVALGWFVIVELAGQGLLASMSPGLARWTLTQNVAALIGPGGVNTFGGFGSRTICLSNLNRFWHLALVAGVVSVLAAGLLRRRDL